MSSDTKDKVVLSDAEWRDRLSADQYAVTRQHRTERAGTGPYLNEKRAGIYKCVCCGADLFPSQTKYESGSGWPSFYDPLDKDAIAEFDDNSLFMRRTEIRCARCDAHLGHVFPDGPRPTGRRYCTNGLALDFAPDDEQGD
ncbi:peptide-methionine (R)-S-oxide reductase MsrB [Breoghania sp.]|uniref:peptide-methionine (R)-S-oxide reductase MsrB n=1 Tax=Breoghania sp. TaxID=2065378 RepID=UPI002625F09A|nr:peptide-methionine (R)-S-oxide reductase MsrB [Breoghania sp.]MDJ0931786.1 peptide-methionine (R)-S-oxide reductase MsrB [Breoghania sp.]